MTQGERLPLTRLDNADPALMEELLQVVERVARSAAFVGGDEIEAFENDFAAYCGTRFAVGVSSGTEALALALRALEIGPGDEVIVPANSFIATAEAVSLVGASPRFVDVDPATAVVTAEHVEAAIGPRTRCVIPVHLYGRTVDLDPIVTLARDAGISVIEDACQAHGAWIGEKRAGSIGDAGCFSFYPAKNLGAWGDAGGLVTDDPVIADRVRLLRSHGERPRYHHRVRGTTARLDTIQAAVLRVKLRRLDAANASRRRVAAALTQALRDSPVVTPTLPPPSGDHVYHQYVVTAYDREHVRAHLAALGIATAVHYPTPLHLTEAYMSQAANRWAPRMPVTELLAERICSLPMHPGLSDEEIARIATAIHTLEPMAGAA